MKNQKTFTVLFQLRSDKIVDGRTPIYVRINAHGKRSRVSLKKTIPANLWNPKTRRLEEVNREAIEVNIFLDEIEKDLIEAYNQLIKERKIITPQSVIARYRGEDQIRKTLIKLSEYHKFNMKSVLKQGTLKNYYTTETYIKRFLEIQRNTDDIYLEHLEDRKSVVRERVEN